MDFREWTGQFGIAILQQCPTALESFALHQKGVPVVLTCGPRCLSCPRFQLPPELAEESECVKKEREIEAGMPIRVDLDSIP